MPNFYRPKKESDMTVPNKSSLWLYGKQLQLLCKTWIQIVLKKINTLGNHIMLRLHIALQKLKSWWITFKYTYISPKMESDSLPKTSFEALQNYFTTISDGLPGPFPWPHLCWNTCCSSSFPDGCCPHSLAVDPVWGCHICHPRHWGAGCLKKLLQWRMGRQHLCDH